MLATVFKRRFGAFAPNPAAQIATVLRRCTFGPAPGQVETWLGRGLDELVEALLDDDREHFLPPEQLFDPFGGPDGLEWDSLFDAVVHQHFTGDNQLHERMTWYWHTHFTTSTEASDARFGWQQHQLVRRHALGNFGELARAITTDAAMLLYLDGAGSPGDDPNENYAREFLELFTLGRNGGYTEDDVRAAARVFSGWHVDWESGDVEFDPESHYDRPVTFMGTRKRWTVDSLIEFVCAQPACHRHVVDRLYTHLGGSDASPSRRNELATSFGRDLDIRKLVSEILRGADFARPERTRARQPLEWAFGALHALGHESPEQAGLEYWHLDVLGQVPFNPPNVAGWPLDDRWAGTSQVIARTAMLLDWGLAPTTVDEVAPTVDAVLTRCGIVDPSPSTRAALDHIEQTHSEFDYRLELLLAAALTSPEFTLL